MSSQSPQVLTPEPQTDLDQLEVIERADTPVSQQEPQEILNHLDVEIAEGELLQGTDDSAIQSPVDLAVSDFLIMTCCIVMCSN